MVGTLTYVSGAVLQLCFFFLYLLVLRVRHSLGSHCVQQPLRGTSARAVESPEDWVRGIACLSCWHSVSRGHYCCPSEDVKLSAAFSVSLTSAG